MLPLKEGNSGVASKLKKSEDRTLFFLISKGGKMTLTIELTHQEEAQLNAAAEQEGLEPAALAKRLMAYHFPPVQPMEEADPTLALFDRWKKEDAQMSPEEAEQERRLWEEFEKGINETREAL